MPIYNDDHGAKVLDFGDGDIAVCTLRSDGTPFSDEVGFSLGPAGEIGRPSDDGVGKLSSEVGIVVRMRFRNTESLRVVIGMLSRLYGGMGGATSDLAKEVKSECEYDWPTVVCPNCGSKGSPVESFRPIRDQIACLSCDQRFNPSPEVAASIREYMAEVESDFRSTVRFSDPEHAHTLEWDEHPDGYQDPCYCRSCREYAS